ncbi:MAG TPA: gliding motility-associated C-terminal domain-containing protein, partial [Saprospiraceae bacterium]|nr:gliding motility-associated C-terminal domain-containing protein [Saprospiraceae bacterium]
ITSETVFTVTVTDINGCTYDASVKVCVREPHSNSDFQLVNIITPNGDGKNDELYFGDLSEYPDNSLKIFNRWGNTIFEAKGYQHLGKLFDGTRRGERLPADTYYYILTLGDQKYRSALTILWD